MNPDSTGPVGGIRLSGAETDACRDLVDEVTAEAGEVLLECGEPPLSRAVIDAMLNVPRARFVPGEAVDLAYANTALGIGHGQTISQPLIVALMTHLLQVGPTDTVLEVGTGSGYQAAVLCELVKQVFTVETVPALGASARRRLRALDYRNVCVRIGDGSDGWPEHAPYDGIIVTAATPRAPTALARQLRPGARLVIPLGDVRDTQWLSVVRERDDGQFSVKPILPVRFVPLTGAGAQS